jgi:predicted metal-dependent peptidase
MSQFTNADLAKRVGELMMLVPHIEPFIFILPMRVITADEWPASATLAGAMPTACVSGKEMLFVDSFIGSLPRPKQLGLILHEVLHPAFAHLSDPYIDHSITRESFRKLQMIAMDTAIEGQIDRLAEAFQPTTSRANRSLSSNYEPAQYEKYVGQDWVSIYKALRASAKVIKNPNGYGNSLENGDNPDPIDFIPEEEFVVSAETSAALSHARAESKAIEARLKSVGKVGQNSSIEIVPEEPKAPWQTILKDNLTSIPARVRRSWKSVNRRMLATTGEYYPVISGTQDALKHIYFFVDTSGSTHELLPKVAGDIKGVMRDLYPEKITVVFYDVAIQSIEEYTAADDMELTTLPAGGGTSVKSALTDFMIDRDPIIDPVVFLTDGEDDFSLTTDHIDFLGSSVFWLTYRSDMKTNHGVVINMS